MSGKKSVIFLIPLIVLPVLFFVTMTSINTEAAASYPNSPRAVIQAYCEADLNGDWTAARKFYAGPIALYDTMDVIRSWRVIDEKTSGSSSVITVRYDLVVEGLRRLKYQMPKVRYVDHPFKLSKVKGAWKIVSLAPKQHISLSTASNHVASITLKENDFYKPGIEDMRKALKLIEVINKPAMK